MDIIPFYYQNGQLEALSSTHQWLQQGQTSAVSGNFDEIPPICTSGLNEAIARERLARAATVMSISSCSTTLGTWSEGIIGGSGMLNPQVQVAMSVPSSDFVSPPPITVYSAIARHAPQPMQQQQIAQPMQLRTTSNATRNTLLNKVNRRRKAAIIARCAASSAGVMAPGTSSDLMIADGRGATTPLSAAGIADSPFVVSDSATPPKQMRQKTTPDKKQHFDGSDDSDSEDDEESDVEVLDLDEQQPVFGDSPLELFNSSVIGERQHNDDPKAAQWRASFETAITERYRNKCRRRNMLCRRMLEFNLQRLKATEGVELGQLSLTDLRIREKYAALVDPTGGSQQALLVHRDTGRVFICLEDMFDVLSKFHTERGHGGSRKAMYVEARKRFANVSKEIVREYLRGCEWCAKGRAEGVNGTGNINGNGWGGRRVKAGRGVRAGGTRRAPRVPRGPKVAAIIDGLALRQYFDRMDQKRKEQEANKHGGSEQSGMPI